MPKRTCLCMDLHTWVSSSTCGEAQDGVPCAEKRGLWHRDRKCSESLKYRNITCRGNIGLPRDVRSSLNQHCTRCLLVYLHHVPRHRLSYRPVRQIDLSRSVCFQLAKHDFNSIHLRWRPRWLLTVSCTCVVDVVLVFHTHAVAVLFAIPSLRSSKSQPSCPLAVSSPHGPVT